METDGYMCVFDPIFEPKPITTFDSITVSLPIETEPLMVQFGPIETFLPIRTFFPYLILRRTLLCLVQSNFFLLYENFLRDLINS